MFFVRGKRALCLMLAFFIMICAAPSGVSAKEQPSRKVLQDGVFTMWNLDRTWTEKRYFYSDSYFDRSGKILNEHLRTMSLAVSCSLCETAREDLADKCVLRRIGFSDIVMYDMDGAGSDTIGTVLAKKRIGDTVVVALMLRGYNYGGEWTSNFSLSDSGDATGFSLSAQKALQRLSAYLSDRQITSAKIWVTGYSRSAAVSNFVGKALNENPQAYATNADDIYVYAFEAPNCCADDVAYENIHNIIDCRDMVAYVYPSGWGLSRCGVTELIGDADETIMSKKFVLLSENLMMDVQPVNLSEFLSETFDFLSQHISREAYASQVEGVFCTLSDLYFGMSQEKKDAFVPFTEAFLENFKNDENTPTVLLNMLTNNASVKQFEAFADLLITNLDKTAAETEHPYSEEELETVRSSVRSLVIALIPLIKADAATKITDANGKTVKVTLYHLMTLLGNAGTIVNYHIFEPVFEQLKATDSYYSYEDMPRIGDADGDGAVSVLDATAIQKDLARLYDIDKSRRAVSDVDDDKSLTVLDATGIQKFLAGLGNPHQIDCILLTE